VLLGIEIDALPGPGDARRRTHLDGMVSVAPAAHLSSAVFSPRVASDLPVQSATLATLTEHAWDGSWLQAVCRSAVGVRVVHQATSRSSKARRDGRAAGSGGISPPPGGRSLASVHGGVVHAGVVHARV
jgi:hypothetical protein